MEAECQVRSDAELLGFLLELSAVGDVDGFREAMVGQDTALVNQPASWYCRIMGSRKIALQQRTPLMIAAIYGNMEVLKLILEMDGVDVNSAGPDGATALHCAAAGGSRTTVKVMKLLLESGADLNQMDSNGKYPKDVIAWSAWNGRCAALEIGRGRTLESAISVSSEVDSTGDYVNSNSGSPCKDQISGEKKEYPIDLSLPDIKTGIYGTDEFRMYSFKVKPCSRAYSHDWTECPFVHPGENARRRDPRKYMYSCVPCPEFRKGSCRQGDACEYAHGVFECWLHPAQYRTRLCKDETSCTRRVCFFAHKPEELRPLYPSTGSAMLSPRSSGNLSLDLSSLSPLSLGGSSMMIIPTSSASMSPSGSPMGGSAWANQTLGPQSLQLPCSRLKTSVNAWDTGLDIDSPSGLDSIRQQQLADELANLSLLSGRSNASFSNSPSAHAASIGNRSGKFNRVNSLSPLNLDELFGSIGSPTSISQLQGHPMGSPVQSPSLSLGYQGAYPSSPVRTSTLSLDQSVAAAVLNSKAASLAKRSQSFTDRAALSRYNSLTVSTASALTSSSMLSDWGSPTGKLDWGVHEDELKRLRKSSSSRMSPAVTSPAVASDEPDISWVQSLVKEAPRGWKNSDLFVDGENAEALPSWAEQMYMEQEQMVA